MRAWQGFSRAPSVLVLMSVIAIACCLPALAHASSTEQSILMDDNQLIYASPTHVAATMEQLAALGIDRIKVSVVWSLIAPDAKSATPPHFDATDPNAYPAGVWDRWDLIARLAGELHLGVYFQLTAPAPRWAVSPTRAHRSHSWSHEPNAQAFGQFVQAVGRRYSGSFAPPAGTEPAPPAVTLPLGLSIPNPTASPQPAPSSPIPAVTWWGLWNEPNEGPWLSPQFRTVRHHQEPLAPALYRGLFDAGYAALEATGHGTNSDTILIGETASGGDTPPLSFVRALYCVGGGYRPLRGAAATAASCPASGSPSAFVAANPGLFHAAGYAHHPYSFDIAPNRIFVHSPEIITLANLGQLERALDRSFAAYGRPTGFPLYLTEWGYKSDPPNPFSHTTLTEQANWLNEGEYMTWNDPRVHALAQFLLVDDLPRAGSVPGTLAYWSTFQSGLEFANGSSKPSMTAFRIPLWLPSPHHGRRVTMWGELRPAGHGSVQYATIQFAPAGSTSWQTVGETETASPEGFLTAQVPIPGRGSVRIDWLDPATQVDYYSRAAPVS